MLFVLFSWGACPQPAVAGQREPQRKSLPVPFLPVETAWTVTLGASPAASGALDESRLYVPLQSGQLVALNRETGATDWSIAHETTWSPAVGEELVFVVGTGGLRALQTTDGAQRWAVPVNGDVMAAPVVQDGTLLLLVRPAELRAIRAADGHEIWRQQLGGDTESAVMATDVSSVCVVLGRRLVRVTLTDGAIAWTTDLPGRLSPPVLAGDRVFVGSTDNNFYALHADSGRLAWKWPMGGDVVGAVSDGQLVYVSSLDHLLRALRRGSGNQVWKRELSTRTVAPPATFGGIVLVAGNAPTLSSFDAATGNPIATFSAPGDLQGRPLIDSTPAPFRVAMAVITRDGRAVGLRPTGMMFRDSPLTVLQSLPGRALTREPLVPPDAGSVSKAEDARPPSR